MKKIELLAPAGSVKALEAAICAGADAVYLAGKHFGARAFASNFGEKELIWARRVTEANGVKLYITLNTLVYDNEWPLLSAALDFYEQLQPDALIIQDLGIMRELKRRGSLVPVHLSTQGAWFGQGGIEELQALGVSRVILPRETSIEEIKAIVSESPFDIEVFVHGAMCYSISGRCYWSAALGPRSGNRGTCAQPCRRGYICDGNSHENLLFSPRDLRLKDKIKDLVSSGVASLKIEGRMKSPEYVFKVVSEYRKALDGYSDKDDKSLDEVFSRASSLGFFFGTPAQGKWSTGMIAGREGIEIGKTTGFIKDGLTEIICSAPVSAGDGLVWLRGGKQEGAVITWAGPVKNGRQWLRGISPSLKKNTQLRRTSDGDESHWEQLWNPDMERLPLRIFWSGKAGTPLGAAIEFKGVKLSAYTEEALSLAKNKGLEKGPLEEKFKVFEDVFKTSYHDYSGLMSGLFISGGALKLLKRNLSQKLIDLYEHKPFKFSSNSESFHELYDYKSKGQIRVKLYNSDIPIENCSFVDEWAIPWFSEHKKAVKTFGMEKIIFWLPPILNSSQLDSITKELSNLDQGKFLCFGWEAFELSRRLPKLNFILDKCFNICNIRALACIHEFGHEVVLSGEWRDDAVPKGLKAYHSAPSWNPLVSYTRFPPMLQQGKYASNSHNDKFFVLNIGNGVSAMFLKKKPELCFCDPKLSYQIDAAFNEPLEAKKFFNILKIMGNRSNNH